MVKDQMRKALFDEGKEKIIEIGEITLDNFLKDGFLKELPIIGSLFSAIKIGKTIKEYHFSKKILRFIIKFNDGSISEEKLRNFKERMIQDEEYANKCTEEIFIAIERFDKEVKAEIFARLMNSYIEEIYSWEDLIYHTTVINQMYISDFLVLKKLISVNDKIRIDDLSIKNFQLNKIRGCVERLKSIGFISLTATANEAVGNYYKNSVFLSNLGVQFYNCCVHGIDFSDI